MSRHEISDEGCSLCGVYYECLAHIMFRSWTYAVAVDGGDDGNGTSLLDIRVLVFIDGCLYNFHVVFMPIYDSHIEKTMQRNAHCVLKSLGPNSRRRWWVYQPMARPF
jgi:hypothetical protein